MKKITKLTTSLLMVFAVLFSIVVPASAATVSKATHRSSQYGGSVSVFYVNAKNKNTTKLNYTCTTGHFIDNKGSIQDHEGYFEIKIYGRNRTGESWKEIKKVNIKDVSSTTLSMKGYTQYKVRVYDWSTKTIGAYLGPRFNSCNASWCDWAGRSRPICTFTARSNVKSLAQ